MLKRMWFATSCLLAVWTLCTSSAIAGGWTPISNSQPAGPEYGQKGIYCPKRDSMLIFGGYRYAPNPNLPVFVSDLYEYSFVDKSWQHFAPPGGPSPRVYSMFVSLDEAGDNECRAILYGGWGTLVNSTQAQALGDTWLLSLTDDAHWEQLTIGNPTNPGPRYFMDAVNRRGQVVMFAGAQTGGPTYVAFQDLWVLSVGALNVTRAPSNWTIIPATNASASLPQVRFAHSIALNQGLTPDQDQLILFGGRTPDPTFGWTMLSDVWVYTFSTGTWRSVSGLQIQRADHASTVFNGRFYSFGGMSRTITAPNTGDTFTFNQVLVTNLNPSLNSQISVANLGSPLCVSANGQYGLWCVATLPSADTPPQARFDFAWCVRNDQMYIQAGAGQSTVFSDFWVLNLTQAASNLQLATAADLGASDLASTMYFMIAILSMMVICFMVFVISLRRQRSTGPIFQAMLINRPRVVGARPSVIEALPLKTYRKKEADERRASRRQSRRDSKPNPAAAETTVTVSAAAMEGESITKMRSMDRIDQDDLHDMCAICLTDYEDGEQLRVLPCEHFFHPPCVDQWLRNHNACPMCKQAVDPDPERSDEPSDSQLITTPQSAANPTFNIDGEDREAGSSVVLREGETETSQVIDLSAPPPSSEEHHQETTATDRQTVDAHVTDPRENNDEVTVVQVTPEESSHHPNANV